MKIGLISDTHGYLDPTIFQHLEQCDEVWHAGDIGTIKLSQQLENFKPIRAVYGNIDGADIRKTYPRDLRFTIDDLAVFMTHIGGYPGRYSRRISDLMKVDPPGLFICGHSHILKVIYDKKYKSLHMNPGACGHHGFHKVRTILRFEIIEGSVKNAEVIELGLRGAISRQQGT